MSAAPSYFATLKAEVGRVLHDLSNAVAVASNNARFLTDEPLELTPDQWAALRDTASSSERAAALLREIQTLLG